jgi:hypothetical protein
LDPSYAVHPILATPHTVLKDELKNVLMGIFALIEIRRASSGSLAGDLDFLQLLDKHPQLDRVIVHVILVMV